MRIFQKKKTKEQETKELINEILLSAQRELCGSIYPAIRGIVFCGEGLEKFKIVYYLDREPNEEDYESVEYLVNDILKDVDVKEIEKDCIFAPKDIYGLSMPAISEISFKMEDGHKFCYYLYRRRETDVKLLLSAQQALLGMVYPDIRKILVALDFEHIRKFKIVYYLDREPNEEDYENINIVADKIIADTNFKEAERICKFNLDRPLSFDHVGDVIYSRQEGGFF